MALFTVFISVTETAMEMPFIVLRTLPGPALQRVHRQMEAVAHLRLVARSAADDGRATMQEDLLSVS